MYLVSFDFYCTSKCGSYFCCILYNTAQPAKGIKSKMRGCKLRSGVYWKGVLKQKGIKQVECETRAMCTMLWELDLIFQNRDISYIIK